jgi:hypothetical protein
MQADRVTCVSCGHEIDAAAKVCAFCGSEPRSGEKIVDAEAMLREVFHTGEPRPSHGLLDLARQRQGMVVIAAAVIAALLLGGVWSFVSRRNDNDVSANSAVPLAEVAEVSPQDEEAQQPMPEMVYQYDGHPQTMRTYVLEPGAVAPASQAPAQSTGATAAARPPAG